MTAEQGAFGLTWIGENPGIAEEIGPNSLSGAALQNCRLEQEGLKFVRCNSREKTKRALWIDVETVKSMGRKLKKHQPVGRPYPA